MAAIRGRNTKPEMTMRSLLHRAGFRFRLHSSALPGKPDMVLPRYRAAIFVHGCFWHQHGCTNSVMPKTRRLFWKTKLDSNCERDQRNARALRRLGWRVITVWECRVRGDAHREATRVAKLLRGGEAEIHKD